jgi:Bacterial DNA-binding protein
MGSRHLASETSVTAGAFVGTNPTDELITSGLLVIRPEAAPRGSPFQPYLRVVNAHLKARMGRNPQTGEAIKITAKTVVLLRPAKVLKDAVLK